jgi:hypothetical protein
VESDVIIRLAAPAAAIKRLMPALSLVTTPAARVAAV